MEDDYLKYLLDINRASANRDLSTNLKALDLVSNSLGKIVNSLYENKANIEKHHSELESKFFRYIMANQSIISLSKGINYKLLNKTVAIIDTFSIKSIMRYQIESYLVMFYLFFDKVNTSELNLRYTSYKLHGLIKQNNFAQVGEYSKKKALEVQKEIEVLKTEMKANEEYLSLDNKAKKAYLNPRKAIQSDRKLLFKDSGLNKARISDMWSIYSNYAHAEHISDRQFNSYYKLKTADLNSDLVSTIEISLILTSKLALFLADSFESCKEELSRIDLKSRTHINLWGKLHQT